MARRMSAPVRMIGLVALLGGVTLAAGCNKASKKDDLLMQENGELRQRIAQLEADLSATDEQLRELSQENQDLRSRPTPEPAENFASDPDPYAAGAVPLAGAEGVTISQRAGGETVVAIAGDVLFDSGSATLKPSAKSSLNRVADILKQNHSGNPIRIEGYTDADPIRKSKWGTNERLSAERALAVETYLVSRGVDNNRAYSAAFGPANPKSSKQASRRVEIVVLAN